MTSNSHVPPLAQGTTLESFRIDGVLGAGGFGITYKARDTRLDRDVAVKEYLPAALVSRDSDGLSVKTMSDSEKDKKAYAHGLTRFLDEARTLAKFNIPSVVRVIYFFTANNSAYMVMQYEEGEDLARHLRSREWPVPEEQIRALMMQLLHGLQQVHDAGVLHRDIKPSNIYIRADGSPVLLDFGSARQQTEQELTQDMTAMVSSGYAPYEQYSRRGRQGPWSDLYSLGSTFYYCISGKHPTDSMERFMAMHNGEDDPLAPLDTLRTGPYSEQLLRVVSWMMQTTIEARPQSADDLLAALAQGDSADTEAPAAPVSSGGTGRSRSAWDDETLTQAEQELAAHIGPMAKFVVKRAARSTQSVDKLYERLAESIESDTERARFLARAGATRSTTGQRRGKAGKTQSWDPETLEKVTQELTEYIGPMARILVKKAARQSTNRTSLYQTLAGHIDSEVDRRKFLAQVGK